MLLLARDATIGNIPILAWTIHVRPFSTTLWSRKTKKNEVVLSRREKLNVNNVNQRESTGSCRTRSLATLHGRDIPTSEL
jgi:hypothetical protein